MLYRYLALKWIDTKRTIDAKNTPLPDGLNDFLDDSKNKKLTGDIPNALLDLVESSPFMDIPCVNSQQVSFYINMLVYFIFHDLISFKCQQPNSIDCGPYSIKYCEHFVYKRKFKSTQVDIDDQFKDQFLTALDFYEKEIVTLRTQTKLDLQRLTSEFTSSSFLNSSSSSSSLSADHLSASASSSGNNVTENVTKKQKSFFDFFYPKPSS